MLVKPVCRVLCEDTFIQYYTQLHLLGKLIFITSLYYLSNPLPVSLQHLCPSAIVLQWEAAVAVQAGHDERLFLFFLLLNYSPPKPLVASQDTPQRTSNASKS